MTRNEDTGGVQALSAAPASHNASRALQGLDFIMRVYEPCMGKSAPDEEMAAIVDATKKLLLGWWGEHRDTVRAALAASPTPPAEHPATTEAVTPKADATTGAALGAKQAAPKAAPAPGERCQHCIERNDGFYGSYAPDCPYHDEDGNLRAVAPKAAPWLPMQERPQENTLVWVADPTSSTGVKGFFADSVPCPWWYKAGLVFLRESDAAALGKSMRAVALSAPKAAPGKQSDAVKMLTEYAMRIARERELWVLGREHDSEGALDRFQAAVARALAAPQQEAQDVSDCALNLCDPDGPHEHGCYLASPAGAAPGEPSDTEMDAMRGLSADVQAWRTRAAPQQEAQEPFGWAADRVRIENTVNSWCAYLDIFDNDGKKRIGTIHLCKGIDSESSANTLVRNWARDLIPAPFQEPFGWACWIDESDNDPRRAQFSPCEPLAYRKRKPLYTAPQPAPAPLSEDTALLDFIEQHPEMFLRHRKGRWAFAGFTNYAFELLPTLRDAVRAALAAQKEDTA